LGIKYRGRRETTPINATEPIIPGTYDENDYILILINIFG
jgi:hypothetical protein